jgi:metallo-beta-lactamase class B
LHWTFEFEERLELGGEKIHLFYPGPGHTRDNIVVWLPRRRILFVGCLVKSAVARDLGNVEEADVKNWPVAVRRIIERYRDAEILVPGHGKPGGVELLSHTMELLEQAE